MQSKTMFLTLAALFFLAAIWSILTASYFSASILALGGFAGLAHAYTRKNFRITWQDLKDQFVPK